MTLRPFNNELLEFMYLLTKKQEFMNIDKAAQFYNSETGKNISHRTIRRWFQYLKENGFGYFPEIKYNDMGLLPIHIFMYGLKKDAIDNLLKHSFHVSICNDISNFEQIKHISYLISHSKLGQLKRGLDNLKKERNIKNHIIFPWSNSVSFYSRFHKNVTENGLIKIRDSSIDDEKFEQLKKTLEHEPNFEMHKKIRKNPFIIPILFEYSRECWSSNKVWFTIKEKLGDDIWRYIRDLKKRVKRKDGTGIKFVQEIIKEVNEGEKDFFKQISIVFEPLFNKKNLSTYLCLTLKERDKIIELAKELAPNSLITKIYSPIDKNSKQFMFFILTSNHGFNSIIKTIRKYVDTKADNKILLMDRGETNKYWKDYKKYLKFNYHDYFDPEKVEWKYRFGEGFSLESE